MNFPRVALAAVSAWVLSLVVGFVVNTYVMAEVYGANAAAFRPQDQMNLALGFGAQLVGFFAFAYMYAKGYEGTGGLQEGLRFGVLIAIVLIGFGIVWNYVVLPVDGTLAVYWVVDTLVELALYGMVVGAVYQPRPSPARRVP